MRGSVSGCGSALARDLFARWRLLATGGDAKRRWLVKQKRRNRQEERKEILEGYPSGQRGQTENLLAHAFGGSTNSPGANLNSRQAGPAGAKGRKPGVIHLPGDEKRRCWWKTRRSEKEILEGYPSGQRGQTVNLLAHAFGGSNPPPSTRFGSAENFMEGGSEPPKMK